MPLEQAVEEHPELVKEHFGKRLPFDEDKFAAGTAAFWTGGVFVHVPKNVRVEKPIQVVWLIDEPGTAQWAHTLVVVGEHAECQIREYFLGGRLRGPGAARRRVRAVRRSRRAGRPRALPGLGHAARCTTSRPGASRSGRDARVKWVPIHLGGHLTKQTLDIITAEPGSDMRHTGMYFTERDEHLDLFTTDRHEAGHTTGDTVWKGALTGESRASYEGLIHIVPKAPEVDTYLQTHQMLLSPKAKGDAIPSLIVEIDNVKASHGGTVGELDQEQIFYMMTRGIPRAEAVRVLVEGYFEEVVQRLDDPGLEELVRRRIGEKLAERGGPGARVHRGARRGGLMARSVADKPLVDVRADFPVLAREFTGNRVAYLDSAATVAEPRAGDRGDGPLPARVLRADPPRRLRAGARVHRAFEAARARIATFVGWDPACSIFTRNATEAINLVAYSWGRENIGRGRRGAHHRDGAPLEHRALAAALRGDRREAALPDAHRQRASCRSTSSTRCSPRGA